MLNLNKKFKFEFLGHITGVRNKDIDQTLTQEEAHKIYLKVVNVVGKELKELGFQKQGTTNFYRVVNNCYQRINFQKSAYGPSMTANIAFKQVTKDYDLNSLKYVLPNNKRLGQLDQGHDKWYPIQKDYGKTASVLLKIMFDKVMPYFAAQE